MNRVTREPLPGGPLVLAVSGRPGPPPLRFETADGGRRLLRQGERPLMLGRLSDEDHCCRELRLRRLDGYRSPLPPVRSAAMRGPGNWPHQYARWLEETARGPLYDGRWSLTVRGSFASGIWTEDLVTEWPDGRLELLCGGGWHGVVPLRRLSPPEAPRVKAYRKHAREGTLAPVLLWWVPALDGWLILDGHDRAVAALAEGAPPPCVVLARVREEAEWRRTADDMTASHEERLARLPPGRARQRAALEAGYADAMSWLPYEETHTDLWPFPGTPATWEDLAARAMFECPRD
ncbi:hypothetical protein [Streptomyces cylindrosporus]|uniref:Uncharacterized protein n=1 Tax=Streptomyces cylindrosporus TaxID=2927583 RepID=A0ABS9XYW9_9ACTN|nr:hypothetical protein [Streptomyces cylindrosporus]MCI3270154.1 hypothetical protein [Streptomyces cylindrosporus]